MSVVEKRKRPLLRQLPLPGVTELVEKQPPELQVVVSLFPGIGLLDKGFEDVGFCVVRGPDLLWGGDIRKFRLPPGLAANGVIGGPPCQDFSKARRDEPTGNGRLMLEEFSRVVLESRPDWWLMENVPGVPNVIIPGYSWQRLDLRASEFGLKQRRLRHIQFGSRQGMVLVMRRNVAVAVTHRCVTARDRDGVGWARFCELQGLPSGFDLPGFTVVAKKRAVGNGVPLPMAKALAEAVRDMVPAGSVRICGCGCGRPLSGNQEFAKAACRMREMRRRNSPSPENARSVT